MSSKSYPQVIKMHRSIKNQKIEPSFVKPVCAGRTTEGQEINPSVNSGQVEKIKCPGLS